MIAGSISGQKEEKGSNLGRTNEGKILETEKS